jgi:hypothetical protein
VLLHNAGIRAAKLCPKALSVRRSMEEKFRGSDFDYYSTMEVESSGFIIETQIPTSLSADDERSKMF